MLTPALWSLCVHRMLPGIGVGRYLGSQTRSDGRRFTLGSSAQWGHCLRC